MTVQDHITIDCPFLPLKLSLFFFHFHCAIVPIPIDILILILIWVRQSTFSLVQVQEQIRGPTTHPSRS